MIKWLEIIDYKLQVMNVIQRFIVLKGTQFDSRFANIPLGILRRDATPAENLADLRQAIRRLSILRNTSRHNAFQQFHRIQEGGQNVFLHGMGNFIALEIPAQRVAFFYFYKRKFSDERELLTAISAILRKPNNQ